MGVKHPVDKADRTTLLWRAIGAIKPPNPRRVALLWGEKSLGNRWVQRPGEGFPHLQPVRTVRQSV